MEHKGADKRLADFLNLLRQAPSERAFVRALANVVLPALRDAYREFLAYSDPLADAPTYRFLELSAREKNQQILELNRYLTEPTVEESESEFSHFNPGSSAWFWPVFVFAQENTSVTLAKSIQDRIAKGEKPIIRVSYHDVSNEFAPFIRKGVEKAATDFNVDVASGRPGAGETARSKR